MHRTFRRLVRCVPAAAAALALVAPAVPAGAQALTTVTVVAQPVAGQRWPAVAEFFRPPLATLILKHDRG